MSDISSRVRGHIVLSWADRICKTIIYGCRWSARTDSFTNQFGCVFHMGVWTWRVSWIDSPDHNTQCIIYSIVHLLNCHKILHQWKDSPVLGRIQEAVHLLILGRDSGQHAIEDVEVSFTFILMDHAGFFQEVFVDFGTFYCKKNDHQGLMKTGWMTMHDNFSWN